VTDRWCVRLLGGFAVHRGAEVRSLPSASERLVALLALEDAGMCRDRLATSLWPESSREHAAGNLRTTLWRLGRDADDLLERVRDSLRLSSEVSVDVREVGALTERARTGGAAATLGSDPVDLGDLGDLDDQAISHTLDLLSAELLPGWYDDWVLMERERHCQRRMHALEQLSDALSDRGRHWQAVDAALAAVRIEPLRESAHRTLVRAHLAEGNVVEALRQYDRFRLLLDDELGLSPTPAFQKLVAAFMRTPRRGGRVTCS
jgi:DNA-binding SARP family transcriptional activator